MFQLEPNEDQLFVLDSKLSFMHLEQGLGNYAFGYNDVTCSPTTTYATYNIINAPKQLCVSPNTGHWMPTEHVTKMWDWIIDELKK